MATHQDILTLIEQNADFIGDASGEYSSLDSHFRLNPGDAHQIVIELKGQGGFHNAYLDLNGYRVRVKHSELDKTVLKILKIQSTTQAKLSVIFEDVVRQINSSTNTKVGEGHIHESILALRDIGKLDIKYIEQTHATITLYAGID